MSVVIKVLLVVLCILLIPISIIWSAYVLTVLWAWFAVPLFTVPALSIAQAAGVSLIATFFISRNMPADTGRGLVEQITYVFLFPLMALFSGWVITLFL